MTMSKIPDILKHRVIGRIVGAKNYYGSFIKVELCNEAGEPAYFRLLYCDWKFLKAGQQLLDSATCSSSDADALNFLAGRSIVNLEFYEGCELRFYFDDGVSLVVRPDLAEYDETDELAVFVIDNVVYKLSASLTFLTEQLKKSH